MQARKIKLMVGNWRNYQIIPYEEKKNKHKTKNIKKINVQENKGKIRNKIYYGMEHQKYEKETDHRRNDKATDRNIGSQKQKRKEDE